MFIFTFSSKRTTCFLRRNLYRGPGWLPFTDSAGIDRQYRQWLFLVPVKGGRWHIIPQLAGKMPLIYHLQTLIVYELIFCRFRGRCVFFQGAHVAKKIYKCTSTLVGNVAKNPPKKQDFFRSESPPKCIEIWWKSHT